MLNLILQGLACNYLQRERTYEIEDETAQVFICYEGAANDLDPLMIAILVNYWREAQEPPLNPISEDTNKRFDVRNKIVVRNKRQTV